MIINLKSQTDLSGFYVVFEGSTNLEKKGTRGLSHLMEHILCKNIDHLQEDFDKDAIEWNAYTTSNEICFYITGLEEKVQKWKYEFIDCLLKFNMTKKDFENEKKIVIEEYMDAANNQTEVHQMNLTRKLFNDFGPIGSKVDLEEMKFIDAINFYELQYTKPSKIINVSKGKPYKNNEIDFSNLEIVKDFQFGEHKVPLELNNNFKDKSSLIMLSPLIEDDFGYVHFINHMLSMGLMSPLYQEVREKKGLVYYIHCYQQRMNKQGLTTIATQTSNKNIDSVIDSVNKILKNPDKYLTSDRFNLIKDYHKVRELKSEILRYENVNQWINPPKWSVYDILEDVNLKKIKEVYEKYFNINNFYISNDKTEFKK
jgi:predicted Zn-dependent peptidase